MSDLSSYFLTVAAKYLSAVDADSNRSNQHEFGGLVKVGFSQFLEAPGSRTINYEADFVYFLDGFEDPITSTDTVSWYDSRRGKPNRSPELRLYYKSNSVSDILCEGDLMIIGIQPTGKLKLFFAPANSNLSRTLCFLFDVQPQNQGDFASAHYQAGVELDYVRATILKSLDVSPSEEDAPPDLTDLVTAKFGLEFPSTRVFSAFARETLPTVDPLADRDAALLQWITREEAMFYALEAAILGEKLVDGFNSVDEFIKLSLSVQNRRKSRAGHSLENHLEEIFTQSDLHYQRGVVTENRSRPDFLFPGQAQYQNAAFDEKLLTMLGAKTTCKDRWRQVLAEAKRIPYKHLVTLEPSISEGQTGEMQNHKLQLVVPSPLHFTYSESQQKWLMSLEEFIDFAMHRQNSAG